MNADINFDPKKIIEATRQFINDASRYAKFTFIIVILVLSGFLVFEINRLINKEPSPEQIVEQQEIIKRPKLDQETIDKIEALKDHNIAARALFKAARDNPFQD
ncbi:MAG TPA: hypothetical protein VFK11_02465 [Candidatus Saccharimonadales bacterium]|nr:hypothetical protein [Candidatus Saccharimonadales bacterium]